MRSLENAFNVNLAALNSMMKQGQNVRDKYYLQKKYERLEDQMRRLRDIHTEMVKEGEVNDFTEDQWEQAVSDLNEEQEKIMETSMALESTDKKTIKLEKIRIPEFSGRLEDWNTFYGLFRTLIHEDENSSNQEKMFRLKTALKGDAWQLIRNMPLSSTGYKTALETLQQRYDNKRNLFNHYLDKLIDQPNINSSSTASITQLLDVSIECIEGIKAMNLKLEDAYPILAHIILRKLDVETRLQYEQTIQKSTEIQDIGDILKFLQQRYQILKSVWTTDERRKSLKQFRFKPATATEYDNKLKCGYCRKAGHKTFQCRVYATLRVQERIEWVNKNEICRNCLVHKATRRCRSKRSCYTCKGLHHTSLHINKSEAFEDSSETTLTTLNEAHHVLIATAQIRVKSNQNGFITLRALIDPCAQTSLISEEAVNILQLPKLKTDVTLQGLGGVIVGKAKSKVNIDVKPRFMSDYVLNIEAMVFPKLASLQQDPTCEYNIDNWDNITLADPDFASSDRIDVLIGSDVYHELVQQGILKTDKLLAQETKLGWILSGSISANDRSDKKFVATTTIKRDKKFEGITENENVVRDNVCVENYSSTKTNDQHFVRRIFKNHIKWEGSNQRARTRVLNIRKK
ncbi:uncharacterized protein LOC142232423 [Haematobia irritans]|uniref:uncharacterized protein LOC142232423 n=1 Tax=Haematobia irritans TaxID=7368 RepID=UPI003F507D3F